MSDCHPSSASKVNHPLPPVGVELRCDVFVDLIKRVRIRTTTTHIFLEQAPEVLEVDLFDPEGNRNIPSVKLGSSVSVSNPAVFILTRKQIFYAYLCTIRVEVDYRKCSWGC